MPPKVPVRAGRQVQVFSYACPAVDPATGEALLSVDEQRAAVSKYIAEKMPAASRVEHYSDDIIDSRYATVAGRLSLGGFVSLSEAVVRAARDGVTPLIVVCSRAVLGRSDVDGTGPAQDILFNAEVVTVKDRAPRIRCVRKTGARRYNAGASLKARTDRVVNGGWPSRPPYGFASGGPSNASVMIPVPDQVSVIRRIFRDYASGVNARCIAVALSEEGVPPPGRSKSRAWSGTTVLNLLGRPVYTGKVVWKGKTYQGKHKPIISEQLFRAVAKKLATRKRGNPRARKVKQ